MPGAPHCCQPEPGPLGDDRELAAANAWLLRQPARERVAWALDCLPERAVLTSSFGAQAAVMLHLVTRLQPAIPVVLIDTGHLFDETYRFVDELVARLRLDLRVFRPQLSAAWQEVRYGRLWEQGAEAIRRYNRLNKVEPMERALEELQAGTWFSGLRRSQARTRRRLDVLQRHSRVLKVYPIVDWSDRDVHRYLKQYDLPYHPLWARGYVSIGDRHSSRPLSAGLDAEQTRFFGLLRECGLHQPERYRPPAAPDSEGERAVAAVREAVADDRMVIQTGQ